MSIFTPRSVVATSALTAALLALAPAAVTADEHDIPGTAGAATLTGTPEPPRPAFYEPPAEIPTTPGTIIRQEKADNVLDPLDVTSASFDARRVMYASQDREGRPIAVTGFVVSPRATWLGKGPRPIISFSVGTQGMGDSCAPSRQLRDFTEYEILAFKGLLLRGYAVALTDYQGLGTPGSHTYMVRAAQGQAVLDMARAAQRVGVRGLSAANPIGLMGYSQGGGGAAAAAELASSYAPELDIKGTAVGAVPADLSSAVPRKLDGSLYSAFELYAIVGLFQGYHVDPAAFLNARGLAVLPKVEQSCTQKLADLAFVRTSTLTKDGRPMHDSFAEEPLRSILTDNRIGNRKPSSPVLLTHSMADDVIPFSVGKQLAKDWCAKDATVWFQPLVTPTHVGGALPTATYAGTFFEARFRGDKATGNCAVR